MNQIVLTGMVLSTAPVGEYDRRVVILTKEQGKISAFARGARRPNSPLVGAVNPFSFGEFTMYEGRSSHTIQSVKITNYFSELREDMIGAYYGFYFLEFANYYTKEQNDEREMLKLLYQTMKALTSPHIPNLLIRRILNSKRSVSMERDLRSFSVSGVRKKTDRWCSVPEKADWSVQIVPGIFQTGFRWIIPHFIRCST